MNFLFPIKVVASVVVVTNSVAVAVTVTLETGITRVLQQQSQDIVSP